MCIINDVKAFIVSLVEIAIAVIFIAIFVVCAPINYSWEKLSNG